jgi:hypothetical protein
MTEELALDVYTNETRLRKGEFLATEEPPFTPSAVLQSDGGDVSMLRK